jgi:hypothetical protein
MQKPNAKFTGNGLRVNAEFWNGIAKPRTFFAPYVEMMQVEQPSKAIHCMLHN